MGRSVKVGAVISGISVLMNVVYGLVIVPLMLRTRGAAEFGLYNMCTSILLSLLVLQAGFVSTYMRYAVQLEEKGETTKRDELNGLFLTVFVALAVIMAAVGVAIALNTEFVLGVGATAAEIALTKKLMLVLSALVALNTLNGMFLGIFTARERFVFVKSIALFDILVRTALLFPVLYFGGDAVDVVLVWLGVVTVELVCYVVKNVSLGVKFRFSNFDWRLLREILGFTFFILLKTMVDVLIWRIGSVLVTRYRGAEHNAVFGIGLSFYAMYQQLGLLLSGFLIPAINRLTASKKENAAEMQTELMLKVGRLQFFICSFVITAFAFFGRAFIADYAGEGYEGSYVISLLMMISMLLPFCMQLAEQTAVSKNLHRKMTVGYTLFAVATLAISIPLTKLYGEIGAAVGLSIGVVASYNIYQIVYSHKVVGMNMKSWGRSLLSCLPSFVIPCIVGALIMLFGGINKIAAFIPFAVLYTAVYWASVWFIGMKDYERNLFLVPAKRILAKITRKQN
ncbi:MAG: oligosaccharide flippase family protein [Oscillospiraceae bacterium]|jgi:O-antigen/teichoic acid export membrane protein|nr:oligosaccharide flippase family protein [Oscillospiraceae bacterium]